MIVIVNYGLGNILSVKNAFAYLGADVIVSDEPETIAKADKIILPGVGSFKDGMTRLAANGFIETLNDQVVVKKKPILGICLGMQMMASLGTEGGEIKGLCWFDSVVKKIPESSEYKVPHVGWNGTHFLTDPLFKGLRNNIDFYYVHSYYMHCDTKREIIASCEHGITFPAAMRKENIFATQFHPEKSQDAGIKILENFLQL